MTAHTFNYHEEPEDSFLKWAMVHFTTHKAAGERLFEELSDATDKFKNVELKITVSGVEVDAKEFMARLDQAVDWAIERKAKAKLTEIPRFDELHETLSDIEQALKVEAIRLARDAGIDLVEEDWER